MVFPIAGGTQDTSYEIENSLRFEDGDSPELTFTPSSAGTQTKFTISLWFKLGNITSTRRVLFGAGDDYLRLADDDNIQWHVTDNGGTGRSFYAPAKIRDPSAWYHVVALWDTTQGTDTNRMRLWKNGVEQTANSFTRPSQNATSQTLNSAAAHKLGGELNPANDFHFDGYISEFYFIDGYAYDYQDFGKFNENGVWIPKDFTGSYGSNGIRLEFKQTGTSANSSGMGADTSGNDNHMSVTNLAATDVTTDTPTNNFMIMNPLFTNSRGTFAEGNLKVTTDVQGSVPYGQVEFGSFAVNKGKWYYEAKINSVGSGGQLAIGWNERAESGGYINGHNNLGSNGNAWYGSGGNIKIGSASTQTGPSSYTDDDIIGVAIDLDNDKIHFHKNGSYQRSSDPANNTGGDSLSSSYNNYWTPWMSKDDTNHEATVEYNFGNPTFTVSSSEADDNGYGSFEYDVPTGYYSLCTKNLAEFG